MKKLLLARGLPPISIMSHLKEAMLTSLRAAAEKDQNSFLQYSNFAGFEPLRSHIAQRFGVNNQRVFVGNGSMDTLNTFLLYLRTHAALAGYICGKEVYDRPLVIAKSLGLNPQGVDITSEGLNIPQTEALIKQRGGKGVVYTIPWFDNPSGILHSEANKAELQWIADSHGWYVIRDGAYLDLSYFGAFPYPSVPENVIQTFSFSKTISAAWHTGGIIVPELHAAPFLAFLSSWRLSPVLPTQMASYDLLYSGAHLEHMEKVLLPDGKNRVEHFNALMTQYLAESKRHEIRGGHFWGGKIARINEHNWESFVRIADEKYDVQIPHHSGFMPLSPPEESVGYIRIPLFLEDPEVADPLDRIVQAIANARAEVS